MNENEDEELKPELPLQVRSLLSFINKTPALLSLLYDLALIPEQCTQGSRDWTEMLIIAKHWQINMPGRIS